MLDDDLPMFDGADDAGSLYAALPVIAPHLLVRHDYEATGLSLKAHPISFVRQALDARKVTPNHDLLDESRFPHGKPVRVAGVVLVRQRPGTASGIVFMTIEDESGIANLVLFPNIYERFRSAARHSTAIVARGNVERNGQVVHVRVTHVGALPLDAGEIPSASRDFH